MRIFIMAQTILFLSLTIAFEAFGTACLQASQQFTRFWPTCGFVLGYGLAFWFLSLTLRNMPLGVVYATWSGFGIVLSAASGYFLFHQKVDLAAVAGMGMIVAGIAVMHLFSATARL
jgi:small multidrug resistance pump